MTIIQLYPVLKSLFVPDFVLFTDSLKRTCTAQIICYCLIFQFCWIAFILP